MYLEAIPLGRVFSTRGAAQAFGAREAAVRKAIIAADPWGNRAKAEAAARNRAAMGLPPARVVPIAYFGQPGGMRAMPAGLRLHGLGAAVMTPTQPSGILREAAKHAEQADAQAKGSYRAYGPGQGKLNVDYSHDAISQRGGYNPFNDPAYVAARKQQMDRGVHGRAADIAANKAQVEEREKFYAAEKAAGRDPYANIRGKFGFDLTPRDTSPQGKALARYEQLRQAGYTYEETGKIMKGEGSSYRDPSFDKSDYMRNLMQRGAGIDTARRLTELRYPSGPAPRGPTRGEELQREREAQAIRLGGRRF